VGQAKQGDQKVRGNITKRGKASWRLKYDVGVDETGKRRIEYETVRGTRKEADAALAKRINEIAEGRYVAPTIETVETYASHWIENIAPASRAAITIERYKTLLRAHILPGLGSIELQKLDGTAIDRFYASRREMGLAPLTLHHIHSLLGLILASAVKAKKLARSPKADIQTKPKPRRRDKIEVLDEAELAALLDQLKGHWLYMPSLLAASTGLRRGEVLGLRWQDIDLAKGTLQVTQAVEIVGGKLGMKPPKTERSARTIKMPPALIIELERHRKEQLEERLKLGLGGRPELVFTSPRGDMLYPDSFSEAFANKVAGLKQITFHGLRHTHITLLLKSGVPVHVVSARAGHAKPSITLDTYSHLLGGEDNDAAKQAEEILRRVLK
jgi:integrase